MESEIFFLMTWFDSEKCKIKRIENTQLWIIGRKISKVKNIFWMTKIDWDNKNKVSNENSYLIN